MSGLRFLQVYGGLAQHLGDSPCLGLSPAICEVMMVTFIALLATRVRAMQNVEA